MSKSLKNDFWNNYMWLSELRKYKILIIAFITIHNGNCCGYLSTAINYYYPVAIVLGATIPAHIRDTLWRCYINLKSVISIKIDNGMDWERIRLVHYLLSFLLSYWQINMFANVKCLQGMPHVLMFLYHICTGELKMGFEIVLDLYLSLETGGRLQ